MGIPMNFWILKFFLQTTEKKTSAENGTVNWKEPVYLKTVLQYAPQQINKAFNMQIFTQWY